MYQDIEDQESEVDFPNAKAITTRDFSIAVLRSRGRR